MVIVRRTVGRPSFTTAANASQMGKEVSHGPDLHAGLWRGAPHCWVHLDHLN